MAKRSDKFEELMARGRRAAPSVEFWLPRLPKATQKKFTEDIVEYLERRARHEACSLDAFLVYLRAEYEFPYKASSCLLRWLREAYPDLYAKGRVGR